MNKLVYFRFLLVLVEQEYKGIMSGWGREAYKVSLVPAHQLFVVRMATNLCIVCAVSHVVQSLCLRGSVVR